MNGEREMLEREPGGNRRRWEYNIKMLLKAMR